MSEKRKAVYNREADRRWREKNRERVKYVNRRSGARVFLREHVNFEDLEEFEGLIADRRRFLEAEREASPDKDE